MFYISGAIFTAVLFTESCKKQGIVREISKYSGSFSNLRETIFLDVAKRLVVLFSCGLYLKKKDFLGEEPIKLMPKCSAGCPHCLKRKKCFREWGIDVKKKKNFVISVNMYDNDEETEPSTSK